MIKLYTDGSSSGNPGPGGYGGIVVYEVDGELFELPYHGPGQGVTNQQMELMACIVGIASIIKDLPDELYYHGYAIEVYSDSAYLCNCMNDRWYEKWLTNGWKNSNKQDVANRELWETLIALLTEAHVTFHKVKGHSQDKYNEWADQCARAGTEVAKQNASRIDAERM